MHHDSFKDVVIHNCELCCEVFSLNYDLLKHRQIHYFPKQDKCDQLSEIFSNKFKFFSHVPTLHTVATKRAKLKKTLIHSYFKKLCASHTFRFLYV